jgi:hypothetical protein
VAAHGDDPFGTEVPGGEHAEQTHNAVADDGDGLPRSDLGGDGGEPAGAQYVGCGEEAWDQIGRRHVRCGDEGAIGEGDASQLGLGADGADELAVDAGALVAGVADLAGVVRGEEGADDELTRSDRRDSAADLLDDAYVLVTHGGGSLDGVDAAVRPQVRPADTSC